MRPHCAAHRDDSWPSRADHQQFSLLVDLDAHPMVEVAAARVLLVLLEEMRCDGIAVHQVRLELDGGPSGPLGPRWLSEPRT